MLTLVLLVLGLGVIVGICLIVQEGLRRRTPAALRGDWWTSFEREFRAYASEATRAHRPERRRPDQQGPTR